MVLAWANTLGCEFVSNLVLNILSFHFYCMCNWFSVDLASELRPSDCDDL